MVKNYQEKNIDNPPNDIIGIDEQFVFHQPVTLVLSAKLLSLTSSNFTIKDDNGNDYFKCNDELVNKIQLNDTDDFPILNIQTKILSLKDKIYIYRHDKNDEIIASVTQKSVLNVEKYTLKFFNNATDKEEFLDLKCDLMGNTCGVFYGKEKEGAPMVCKIIRKIETTSLLSSPQEYYYINIAPGVDTALIVAATICFDKLKTD